MANKIIHKHSSALVNGKAKLPTAEQLDYGEIAVNYAEGVETISLKNNSGDVVTFESQPTYKTDMPSGLTMVNAVGGINSGTKVSDLSGKTITSILDDLLFPTLIPASTDHTDPSISGFELSPNKTLVEINSSASTISNAVFDPGKWTKYDASINYAGPITSSAYTLTINGKTTTATTLSSITGATSFPKQYNSAGNQSYKIVVNYGDGPHPKDSKGIEVTGLTAPASSITLTREVNVTYPWYASTVKAGTLTKQSLISWKDTAGKMTSGQIKLVAQAANADADKKQSFAIPRLVTKVETLNTLSNQWVTTTSSWNQYGTTTLNGITYYKYNFNTDASNDAQIIKVTF